MGIMYPTALQNQTIVYRPPHVKGSPLILESPVSPEFRGPYTLVKHQKRVMGFGNNEWHAMLRRHDFPQVSLTRTENDRILVSFLSFLSPELEFIIST